MAKNVIYVRDDLGHAWYYRDGKIRMVLAELEAKNKKEREENGYNCSGLEHGIELLNQFGYITGFDEPTAMDTIRGAQ